MKYLLLALACVVLFSCAPRRYCQPPKGSKDYAKRQWLKQRSDGYWIVTTIRGYGRRTDIEFECRPDSAQLAKL